MRIRRNKNSSKIPNGIYFNALFCAYLFLDGKKISVHLSKFLELLNDPKRLSSLYWIWELLWKRILWIYGCFKVEFQQLLIPNFWKYPPESNQSLNNHTYAKLLSSEHCNLSEEEQKRIQGQNKLYFCHRKASKKQTNNEEKMQKRNPHFFMDISVFSTALISRDFGSPFFQILW